MIARRLSRCGNNILLSLADATKTLFGRKEFRNKFNLAAVNSINWARILAQVRIM